MQNSDYQGAFWVAGKLALQNRFTDLYPPPGSNTFTGIAFDQEAHRLLPGMNKQLRPIYMYSPLNALLFAPFALFNSTISMCLWQILSLVAVPTGLLLLMPLTPAQEEKRKAALNLFWPAVLFLPVFYTVLVGQLGLIFGFLPLCLSYYFLNKKKDFAGGLAWAITMLKPQFMPCGLVLGLAFAIHKRFGFLTGLFTGTIIFVLLNIALFGPDVFMGWINCLKLSDRIFLIPEYHAPTHIVISPELAFLPFFSTEQQAGMLTVMRSISQIIRIASIAAISFVLGKRIPEAQRLPLALLLVLLLEPLCSPHFLIYDLCVLLLPGTLLLHKYGNNDGDKNGDSRKDNKKANKGVIAVWIICNIFVLGIFLGQPPLLPAWVVSCGLALCLIFILLQLIRESRAEK